MRKSLIVVLALLAFACDKQPTAPSSSTPVFNYMNNPDNGNFKLVRFQLGYAFCWTDPSNGLRVCNNTVPMGSTGNRDPDCGLQAAIDGIDHQHLIVQDNVDPYAAEIHLNDMGDVWVTVRDMTQPGTCFNTRLVAEGLASFHLVDNDMMGTVAGERNTNTWGYNVEGMLTTPEGQLVHYLGQARFLENERISRTIFTSVKLTP